ncbi:MAG: PilT/PilU family type 4a pilus ATPase [Planctomycetaceae bacterium]|nr:MAG: PilT/PilU family type 4a pilus ATPase [Planctomycetaceae bacterium]
MTANIKLNDKVYPVSDDEKLSLQDLLNFFEKHGSLRVSDLHLKVHSPPIYRVDGDLQKMKAAPTDAATIEAFAKALLNDMEWQRLQTNRSVDGSFSSGTLNYRINIFYDSDGLAIAIRSLSPSAPPVEQIGFPNNVWRDIINRQQGLVLMTGITGAGKSTTIASLIERIACERPCRIITLEDPIEYHLKGSMATISQREVGRDVPSFERGLRDALREDPDVIFVGEMRDRESAAWTLTAAETGHLVFSTIHTRDTRGSITRILDMFPAAQQDEVSNQMSLGLAYVISQKLIPRSDGKGRIVAMEILNNIYSVSNLIRVRKLEQLYTQLQTRTKDVPEERMTSMERSLARLVKQGQITPLEAEKWACDPAAFIDAMQHLQDA